MSFLSLSFTPARFSELAEGFPVPAMASPRPTLNSAARFARLRRNRLLRHFGSVRRIRDASVQALTEVPGISATLAAEIKAALSIASQRPTAEPAPDDGN